MMSKGFIFSLDELRRMGYVLRDQVHNNDEGKAVTTVSVYRLEQLGNESCINWHYTYEAAIEYASWHCRRFYVPPRPQGLPEDAVFRLPVPGDNFVPQSSLQTCFHDMCNFGVYTTNQIHVINENDMYCGRAWCWKQKDPRDVPYTYATFPRGNVWCRSARDNSKEPTEWLITYRDVYGVGGMTGAVFTRLTWKELMDGFQISTDGGEGWDPAYDTIT